VPLELVHRDLSPDNLMVDRSGTVRVLDFGIARAACSLAAATKTGQRRGKLIYAAPEYIVHGTANERIDVYSLGVTLYELCTGQNPFAANSNPLEVMRQVCRVGLPPADMLCPHLPPALVSMLGEATKLDPEQRLATVFGLGTRLDEFRIVHEPPSPEQIGEQVGEWQRRLRAAEDGRGSLGPLEPTRAHPGPQVAIPTEVIAKRPQKPPPAPEPSVVLSPELAALLGPGSDESKRR
jgi:serine/threonine-protein kinase